MSVKFSNNATTELASSIGTSDTSITVVDGSKFPILTAGDHTYVTLDTDTASPTREIVRVTAISGNVLTVTRGQDGTSPASFAAGTKVELRLTAALLNDVAGANPSGEPIGFPDKSQTTITFDSGIRTFSITPTGASFDVYCKGIKYTYTTVQLVTIPNTTGLHFIYFSASGVLSTQMSYFTWEEHAPTAYVYWNATTQQAIYFGDERHGITLDWQTHEYLHRTRGAAIANGFAASGYTTTGLGATDADAQIDIGGGTFFDEDMQVDIVSTNTPVAGTWQQDLSGPARIPVMYLSGAAWVIDSPTNFPFKVISSVPQYNLLSGSTWSTAGVTNNSYFVSWILATNNLTYPVISIISQAPTNQLSIAEAMTFEGLNLNGFPSVEFRPLYKVIYQYKDNFANSVKSSTIAVYDLRSISSAGVAAALVQDHGNLSGLTDDDHPQYVHTSEVRTPSAAVKNSFFPSQVGQTGKYLSTNGTNTVWEPAPSGSLSFTGDVTGSGSTGSSVAMTLAASGVVAGQYTKVTVDAKGRVTAGTGVTSADVTSALGYTPYNATNPAGYTTNVGTVYSVSGTGTVSGLTLTGSVTSSGSLQLGGTLSLTSGQVTTALGFTPYNATNPSGYISGNQTITVSGDASGSGATSIALTLANSGVAAGTYTKVTVDAKGRVTTGASLASGDLPTYTGTITSGQVTTALGYTPYNATNPSGYITGITSGMVTTALGFTPYNATNPSGYTNNTGTVTSVSGTGTVSGLTLTGTVTGSGSLTLSGTLSLTSGQVTTALGYTPPQPGGTGASGTWGINVTGSAASAPTAAKSSATTVPASTAFAKWMFATTSTSGTLDWNASSNTFPGVGETLLLGSAANGPGGGNYYHPFNIEYSGNEGNGQITQMAIAYGTPANELYMRGRYGGSWSSWVRYLNSSNYSSYALPLSGGTLTGTLTGTTGRFQKNQTAGDYTTAAIWAESYGNTATGIAFHISGNVGKFLEMRTNGLLYFNSDLLLHSGNYTSYSPSLTGSGASGTWGINISGSAASLGGVAAANYFRVDGTYPNTDMNTPVEGYWHVVNFATGLPEGYYGHRWDYDHLNNGQWVAQFYSPTSGDPGLWFRQRRDYTWQTWRKFLDSSNYNSYSPTLTGTGASGTWSISTTSDFLHSDRDFPSGTLITTDINYAVSSGDPFVLEIRGNSYGNAIPLDIQYQGYIYSDTIINHGGIANGLNISGLVAINNGGNLCFWFPSQGYWNGYYVKVYVPYSGRQRNRVTSISGSGKPTTAKEVGLSANIRQSLHSGNYTSYSPSLTGSGASGTWGISISGNAATVGSRSPGTAAGNLAFYDSSSAYLYAPTWIGIGAGSGIFSSSGTNSAHFLPNNGSYGPWKIQGTRNGWSGIEFDSGVTLMTNRNSMGLYDVGYGWTLYWSGGTGYVYKNSNGGGTAATILDSSNYSSYALPLSGGTVSGSINVNSQINFGPDVGWSTFVRGQNHPDQGYTGSGQKYWLELGAYGGTHVTLNMDGSAGSGENGFDHFTIWQAAANSTSGSRQFYVTNIGNVWARNNITAYSDERVKADWSSLRDDFVCALAQVRHGTYTRTDYGVRQAGVSAQSIRELLPEVVTEDNEGMLSVAYGNAAMVSAVELAKELVMLKRELAEIKSRLH